MKRTSFFQMRAADVIAGIHHVVWRTGQSGGESRGDFVLMTIDRIRDDGHSFVTITGKMIRGSVEVASYGRRICVEFERREGIEVATVEEGV